MAPFVLTSKPARDTQMSSDIAPSTPRDVALTDTRAHAPHEHAPPGLHRAPIVPLRV